ncbi:MAG: hypothetical protein WBF13_03605 [Candidatus Zixiibacteriota bacterium]
MTTTKRGNSKPNPPARYTPQRVIWLVLLVVHIILAVLFVSDRSPGTDAALYGFPLDDTWIHMVYARNLAQSGLPYYNDGVLEVGFTSPLWLSFGALGHLIASASGASPVVIMKMLGVLLAWLSLVAIFEICRRFTKILVSSVLCGLYVATMPVMAFSQVSGMEVCLASCLAAWGILCLLKNRYLLGGLFLGLGAIARPENAILTALVVLLVVLSRLSKSRRTKFNQILKLLLPTLILLSLWSLLCLGVTGHLMPNTFYAKSSTYDVLGTLGRIIGEVVLQTPAMFLFSGVLLYALGVLYMLTLRQRTNALIVLLYPWLFIFAVAASRYMPDQSGVYFYWFRYVVPALSFIFIPLAAGFEYLWSAAKGSPGARSKTKIIRLAYLAAILLVIMSWIKLPGQLRFRSSQYAWNCQNINEVQVELGKWVNENTPEDAILAVNDAGALRYFGKRKTIDLLGLNSQSVLFNPHLAGKLQFNLTTMVGFLTIEKARYLVIFPYWFPGVVQAEHFESNFRMMQSRQSQNYTISDAPLDLMAVYLLQR